MHLGSPDIINQSECLYNMSICLYYIFADTCCKYLVKYLRVVTLMQSVIAFIESNLVDLGGSSRGIDCTQKT